MNSLSDKKQRIVLYFQVHQPRRLNAVNFFDIAHEPPYFDDALNRAIIQRVAQHCYIPTNRLLLELIRQHPEIKVTFSLSGIVMEQLEAYAPEAIETFQQLANTGCVEFLAETYYHSLASLSAGDEFETQVFQHAEKTYELFGMRPTVFRNTELIYNNEIGRRVAMMGYQGIFTEGFDEMLAGRSPHKLYHHPEFRHLNIFLRNYRLSDDIAFRFSEGGSVLNIHTYMSWLNAMPASESLINLAMDYETFGEHQKADTGIFEFLRALLTNLATSEKFAMALPAEAVASLKSDKVLSVEGLLSWADLERDVSAWLGNEMQKDAFNSIMRLEPDVKHVADKTLLKDWRYLQTSDHFYYMSVKTDSDGSVHAYFSPFPSSYEAFINYMNVVTHLAFRSRRQKSATVETDHNMASIEAERQEVKSTTPVWVMNLESVPQANVPEVHS